MNSIHPPRTGDGHVIAPGNRLWHPCAGDDPYPVEVIGVGVADGHTRVSATHDNLTQAFFPHHLYVSRTAAAKTQPVKDNP